MIKINIYKNKIEVKGHANYDKHGKDIVCAAVSSCVLTTINSILSINEKSINVIKNENLIIEIISNDEITLKLIKNMLNMLYELKNDYEKYIEINEEV